MINNVTLMGRLTADPELKTTTNGKEYTRFTVAVDRGYAKKGEDRKTDFIDCQAWGNAALFITKYFWKGQMIALTGEIRTETYEKDGVKRKAYTVNVFQVSFTGGLKGKEMTPEEDTSDAEDKSQDWWM